MQVPTDFKDQLEETLNQICAFAVDREKEGESSGSVSQEIMKAEFETNYMIANCFRNREYDLIFSTESDVP